MRPISSATLVTALLLAGGCGSGKPMTVSEFKGFCYQSSVNRDASCDAISLCDEYLTVLEIRQPSVDDCIRKCAAVYGPQFKRHVVDGCSSMAQNAEEWCERYCRTAYPK